MIYTSYFGKLKSLPKNIVPVAICGGLPEWYHGAWYKKLAPPQPGRFGNTGMNPMMKLDIEKLIFLLF